MNVGVVTPIVPVGPESIVVFGAVASTVNVRDAGVGVDVAGRVGGADQERVGAVGQRRRGCAATCRRRRCRSRRRGRRGGTRSVEPVSLEENANVAEFVVIVPVGPVSIVVFGAAVSTVKVREAGVGSTLPAVSRARTSNVCAPCARFVYACGDVHGANAALSRRHSNVEPGLVDGERERRRRVVGRAGRAARDRGVRDDVSTVNVREAGVASTLPAASMARTRNVYVPSTSGPSVRGEVQLTYVPVAEPGPSRRHSKRRAGLAGGERELRRSRVDRAGRAGVDRRVRRGRVHRERARRGRRVDVAGGVARADLEGVRALRQRSCRSAARCRPRTRAASRRHSNVTPALGAGEREGRRGGVRSRRSDRC